MGKLIATTQATVDGVVDPVAEWVQPGGDHGEYSFERQARSGGMVLGRKTYEGLAGYWPSHRSWRCSSTSRRSPPPSRCCSSAWRAPSFWRSTPPGPTWAATATS